HFTHSDVPAPAADDQKLAAGKEPPLTIWNVTKAWMPFAVMSITLMLTGLVRQRESEVKRALDLSVVKSYYQIPVSTLDGEVARADRLKRDPSNPAPEPEDAVFKFIWLSAPGTPVFLAALFSIVFLRMNLRQIYAVFRKTFVQMKIPIPTIAFMIG